MGARAASLIILAALCGVRQHELIAGLDRLDALGQGGWAGHEPEA